MVIDTDGSAFITKAEFDSLKNNFQSQLDTYNSSLDNKIDSAIAAYLSGVKISSTNYPSVFYDNSWLWTSKTDYSFDTIKEKKFWHNCDFYFRTASGANGYQGHRLFVPVADKLFYKTFEIDEAGMYTPVKICFRCAGVIHFGRAKDTSWLNDPGGVRWFDFWPVNNKEGEVTIKTADSGSAWWYTGMTVVTVDYDDSYAIDVLIAPKSDEKTYYYKAKQILMKDADKGAADYDGSHWTNKRTEVWASDVQGIMSYYPNQLVSTDTNKNIETKKLIDSRIKKKSEENGEMQYGIHLINATISSNDKISIKFIPENTGVIKFAFGDSAKNAWETTTPYDKWDYSVLTADVGNETTIEHTFLSSTTESTGKLFMIYLPDGDDSKKIEIKEVSIISQK